VHLLEEPVLGGVWHRDIGRASRAVGRRLTAPGIDAEDGASEIAFDIGQLEPVNVVGSSGNIVDIFDGRYEGKCISVIRLRILAKIELGRDSRLGRDEGEGSEEARNRRISDGLLKVRGGGELRECNVGDVGECGCIVDGADVDDRSDSSYRAVEPSGGRAGVVLETGAYGDV